MVKHSRPQERMASRENRKQKEKIK